MYFPITTISTVQCLYFVYCILHTLVTSPCCSSMLCKDWCISYCIQSLFRKKIDLHYLSSALIQHQLFSLFYAQNGTTQFSEELGKILKNYSKLAHFPHFTNRRRVFTFFLTDSRKLNRQVILQPFDGFTRKLFPSSVDEGVFA